MAPSIFVPGLIAISVKPATGTKWDFLGYCRDGVYIREQLRTRPIYGDEGGGPDGIPVDYSFLGEYHEVRLELYKYDGDVLSAVCNRLSTSPKDRSKVWEPGWLMRGAGDHYQLQLKTEFRFVQEPPAFNRIYPVALPLSPVEYPVGPKEMLVILEWTCLPSSDGTVFTTPLS